MLEMVNLLLNSFDVYEIVYKGQGLSWNEFYAGGGGRKGWAIRKQKVDKYHKIFYTLLLQAKLPWFEEYGLILYYNSRHDPDNALANTKIMLDCLKQEEEDGRIVKKGYCKDDSPKYCKMVTAIFDSKLEKNEFRFNIVKIK